MASQEQGCRAVRQAVVEGGNERDVVRHVVDVLTTLSLVNAAELTATVYKTYLVPCSEPVDEAMAEAGRRHQEAAGAIKNKPEAERAEAHEQLGPPYLHVWVAFFCNLVATKGLAAEHVSTVKTCWESNMVKSASVELASRVRHCRAKPCQKIEGKEGWMRSVFCLDTVTLPLEEALDAALRLQKGVRNHDPAPRGPLEREASRLLTQMRVK